MMNTIKNSCAISGVGIHTGKIINISVEPSSQLGITFIRCDQKNARIQMDPKFIQKSTRCTVLKNEVAEIMTPEHLLAACSGLNLTGLNIMCSGPEIPICDGSSNDFVEMFLNAGLTSFNGHLDSLHIDAPFTVQDQDRCIYVLPSDELVFTYYLSYPESFVGTQTVTYSHSQTNFVNEIAAARTFGFEKEVNALLASGLAKGGSLDNAVVIGEHDYVNKVRFPDELVRHKILDMVGDFFILGRPINAHIIGIKSGHALNAEVVKQLSEL